MESSSPFSSQFYKILVGPSAHPVYVHAGVLSKSEVLKREVYGQWKESEDKQIIWPHWNVSAVEKFVEWLYTGDYKCPFPTKVETLESPFQQSHNGQGRSFDDEYKSLLDCPCPRREKAKEGNTCLSTVWFKMFNQLSSNMTGCPTWAHPLPRLDELDWAGCRKLSTKLTQAEEYDKWTGHQFWRPEELDYEEVFMTHAELYVMACTYMVDHLKNMAWQRLRSVLKNIGVPVAESPLIKNLANLIHYTFKETGTSGDDEDPLRMLVTAFAALHFTTIKGSEIDALIMSPLRSDREFVIALTSRTTQQLKYLEALTTIGQTSVFASVVFQIVVGAEQEVFYAHASQLSKSEVLRKEVEGSWKESEERKIVWSHWSVDAATRVIDWLYTGDYDNIYPCEVKDTKDSVKETGATVPHGVKRPAEEPPAESPSKKANGGFLNLAGQKDSSQRTVPVTFPSSLAEANPNPWDPQSDINTVLLQLEAPSPQFIVQKWRNADYKKWRDGRNLTGMDFEAPFMTHAEIYMMACHYLLDQLKNMAWRRLRSVMCNVGVPTPESPVTSNLMELIEYVYEETGGSIDTGDEPLRNLVSTFATLYFPAINGPALIKLMRLPTQPSEDFVIDLTDKLAKRMISQGSRAYTAENRAGNAEYRLAMAGIPNVPPVNTFARPFPRS
ncbi:MAG: hypothetical protein LQ350_004105 [Teloschistes chrysophthalmus]|nr:MAG: hypothetical protein LQ350_004105 [Niorma chrysophthalma]